MPVAKGKNKRVQAKQPARTGGKDASSNSSSSKRSKSSEVRRSDDDGSAATNKKQQTTGQGGTSSGSKNSAQGSTAAAARRINSGSSTVSKKNLVGIPTAGTSLVSEVNAMSAVTSTPPANSSSLYQQRVAHTSTINTGRNPATSTFVNLSPLAQQIPTNVVHGGNKQGVDETSLVTENNSVLYNQELWDTKRENEYRMSQLKEYVRNDLFPNWKFFSSKKQMVFSNKPGGIVLKICNDLKVHNDHQMYWWDTHKKSILDVLNRKRNDVTSYLKKRFCGKLNCIFCSLSMVGCCCRYCSDTSAVHLVNDIQR